MLSHYLTWCSWWPAADLCSSLIVQSAVNHWFWWVQIFPTDVFKSRWQGERGSGPHWQIASQNMLQSLHRRPEVARLVVCVTNKKLSSSDSHSFNKVTSSTTMAHEMLIDFCPNFTFLFAYRSSFTGIVKSCLLCRRSISTSWKSVLYLW